MRQSRTYYCRPLLLAGALIVALGGTVLQGAIPSHAGSTIRIGALYPLSGSQSSGGTEEYHGVQIAAQLINASGGIGGKQISFATVDAPSADAAPGAVDSLRQQGVRLIMGSYGSTISLPASTEAQRDHLIFWESGAVATMITERGYPNVFRTVTTGNSLGRAAARYAATVIAPRVHLAPRQLRAAVIYANDVYGSSVGRAMNAETHTLHFKVVGVFTYDPYHTHFPQMVKRLKQDRPDIVLVAGYVQDAVAFRRETIKQHLQPAAMIGTSSAFCMPAFGQTLGPDALGLFASDKPDATFSPSALRPAARALLQRATTAYHRRFGVAMSAPAVAGFVAGWVLFHDVLPHARSLDPADVRAAALRVNLPYGSEINGAGVRFAGPNAPDAGQNLRAISVIWQWQEPGHEYVVYPPSFATEKVRWIPLPGWHHQ
jgi:branched-chain amino acid transport system substrate-binding protein